MGVSMKETIRKRGSRGDIWWRDGVPKLAIDTHSERGCSATPPILARDRALVLYMEISIADFGWGEGT